MSWLLTPLLFLTLILPVYAADNPWVALTQHDLQAIHDLLQENHPGPVDPENKRYKEWLEEGLKRAGERAQSAACFSDYVRVLRSYTNGFQDGHIGIGLEVRADEIVWPGFLVEQNANGQAEVAAAEKDSGVTTGDKIFSCDGQSIDSLMKQRVDPYYWNSAIPHERYSHLFRLFYQDRYDSQSRFQTCKFSGGDVTLIWRAQSSDDFQKRLDAARGAGSREPRIQQLNGVWLITVPTLAYSTEEKIKKIRNVINEISARAAELRRSTVVFDVRGNHGGDSGWGEELAAALWGHDWVSYVTGQFDNTADWRASESNYKFVSWLVEREEKAALTEQVAYVKKVRDAIRAALDAGRPLARVEDRPQKTITTPPRNPISGQVYFFTDGQCASACLDFADVMRKLPGVTHVGLPTSADAIYIDNTYTMLPSGLAGLGYSMKVFRNRMRGNNVWYEPEIRWPGGPLSDESITEWIAQMKSKR